MPFLVSCRLPNLCFYRLFVSLFLFPFPSRCLVVGERDALLTPTSTPTPTPPPPWLLHFDSSLVRRTLAPGQGDFLFHFLDCGRPVTTPVLQPPALQSAPDINAWAPKNYVVGQGRFLDDCLLCNPFGPDAPSSLASWPPCFPSASSSRASFCDEAGKADNYLNLTLKPL